MFHLNRKRWFESFWLRNTTLNTIDESINQFTNWYANSSNVHQSLVQQYFKIKAGQSPGDSGSVSLTRGAKRFLGDRWCHEYSHGTIDNQYIHNDPQSSGAERSKFRIWPPDQLHSTESPTSVYNPEFHVPDSIFSSMGEPARLSENQQKRTRSLFSGFLQI